MPMPKCDFNKVAKKLKYTEWNVLILLATLMTIHLILSVITDQVVSTLEHEVPRRHSGSAGGKKVLDVLENYKKANF